MLTRPLLSFTLSLGCAVALAGQARGSQMSVVDVIRGLQSAALERRAQAIVRLNAMADAQKAMVLRDTGIQEALVALLERENSRVEELYLDGRGTSGVYGESYSEYYSTVLDIALATLEVMDTADPPLKRALLSRMVHGTYNSDSPFVHMLAAYGDLVADVAVDLTYSALAPKRWNGYAVLGAALGVAEQGLPMKAPLSDASRRRALAILERGLMSRDVPTARHAIRALGESRTREAAQILNALLQRPESAPPAEERRYPTTRRQEVLRAIDVIRSWQERKR